MAFEEDPDAGSDGQIRDICSYIGMAAVEWARFELAVDVACIQLAKVNQDAGFCLTSQIMGSSRKLDAFISIAKLRGASELAGELDTFAKKTTKLAERRNRIVHDPIAYGDDNISLLQLEVSARKSLIKREKAITTDKLLEFMKDLYAHWKQFEDIVKRVKKLSRQRQACRPFGPPSTRPTDPPL